MTREDTKELIRKIASVFPSWKIESPTKTINDWQEYLVNEDNALLKKALAEYIENGEIYAPSLGVLIKMSKKYKPDPRFEGIEYWESRTKGLYPYEWDSKTYREWYSNDREADRFYRFMTQGIDCVERRVCGEDAINNLSRLIKRYEDKKCSMMKKG